ncbi:MAG: glutaredoxin family protein [Planctomycetota bacterium]|nr:glutaredoxin family protein [Planctomycetota bacterium]
MKNEKVILYTRQGCHLCDIAEDLLRKYRLDFQKVDIDQDPSLVRQFDQCVPVVEIDGRVRFRGKIDEILLQRLL